MAVEFDEGGGLVVSLCFDESEIGVDFALAVEPEAEEGLVWFEVVYLSGEHVVEECVAFCACDFEGGHVWFVEDDACFAEGGVFHVELAEGFDDGGLGFWRAVVEEVGLCGGVEGVQWAVY